MDKSYRLIGGLNDGLDMLINDGVDTVSVPYFPDLIALCMSDKATPIEPNESTYVKRALEIKSGCEYQLHYYFASDDLTIEESTCLMLDRIGER